MKKSISKNTIREIKQSFTRWVAILAIIALGVGFFSGLELSKPAFIKTGQNYLDESNFFDFELISTLGIEEENLIDIRKVAGVNETEGSYSSDVYFVVDRNEGNPFTGETMGSQKVAKLHAITDAINKVELRDGRMPLKPNECVVDHERFTNSDLGKVVCFTEANDDDTLDLLKEKEFTIVGTICSPLYMNYERGSTSLGSGSVDCYIYIPKDAWDSEYYTEMYVTMDEQGPIYSDEYEANADAVKERLEPTIEALALDRYNSIMDEADEKISDAEKKLNDAKADLADGEKTLRDNQKKIQDAKQEIADNEKTLLDSRDELENAWEQYYESLDQYQKEYDAAIAQYGEIAKPQFESAKAELDRAYDELTKNQKEWDEGYAKLEDAKKEIKDGEKELKDGEKEIADAKEKISDAEVELQDAKDEIADIEKPDTYVLGRNTNVGYVCFDNDSSIVEGISKVFPVFFFLVAALVVMTTMTRMIDEQRTQIGVLKALGYSKRTVLNKYILYSGSAALIGGVGGFIGGSYLFPWVIWKAYGLMYGFSDLIPVIDWVVGGLAILVAMICAVGSTLFSCYSEMKEVPAQLIRPKAPAIGKRIWLEYIKPIWSRMPFLHKVSARNIFRYKKRFFMMVLGICGCTALLITGFGINDSIKNVVDDQYEEIYKIDYSVNFKDPLDSEREKAFLEDAKDETSDCIFLYQSNVDIHIDDQIKDVNLVVADDGANIEKFISLFNDDGPISYPKKGEGVLNQNIADRLGISAGDTIVAYNGDMKKMELKIVALCKNYVYNYLYISKSTYEEQIGELEKNAAFVLGKDDGTGKVADPNGDGAKLMEIEGVSAVSVIQTFRDRVTQMMSALDYVIALILICAGALAFIVLYNLTNINITERIREIATIKVLGFYASETDAYVFRENVVLTAISCIVGIPLGQLLHSFVMAQVQIDMISFNVHIAPISYVFSIAMTFVFALIVNFAMHFRLIKINMAESLKSIE